MTLIAAPVIFLHTVLCSMLRYFNVCIVIKISVPVNQWCYQSSLQNNSNAVVRYQVLRGNRNFRSQELSLPGAKVPPMELSLPGAKIQWNIRSQKGKNWNLRLLLCPTGSVTKLLCLP